MNKSQLAEKLAEFEGKVDWEGGWDDAIFGYGMDCPLTSDEDSELAELWEEMEAEHQRYETAADAVKSRLKSLAKLAGYTNGPGYF